MYDSGISAKELISDIKSEADISPDIPDKLYVQWLNGTEQLLYREIIKEQGLYERAAEEDEDIPPVIIDSLNAASLSGTSYESASIPETLQMPISAGTGERDFDICDINAVFVYDQSGAEHQLIHTSYSSSEIFSYTYSKDKYGNLKFHCPSSISKIKIFYFKRPCLKTIDESGTVCENNVMIPVEFIDLIKSKLRGEAYKLANEDGLASKWINDYNILLETFKEWISTKNPNFGL